MLFSLALAVTGLTSAVVAQWWTGNRRAEKRNAELRDIILKNVEAMNLVGNNLERLRDAGDDGLRDLKQAIERLRTDLISKLDKLPQ